MKFLESKTPEDQAAEAGTRRCPALLINIVLFYADKFTLQALLLLQGKTILVSRGTGETCIVKQVVAVISKIRSLEVILQPLPGALDDPAFRALPVKVILLDQANAGHDFTLTNRNLIGKFEAEPDVCGDLMRLSRTSDGNNLCIDTLNNRRRTLLPCAPVQGACSESRHFCLPIVFSIMARFREMLDHKTPNMEHRPTPEITAQ